MCAARPSPSAFESLESRVLFAAGDLDSLFSGGKATFDLSGGDDFGFAVAVQSDGKVLLAGRTQPGASGGNDFAVLRLNADGSLDTTFGVGGLVKTDLGSPADSAYALAVQSDGKIVVAGETRPTGFSSDFAMIRYNANGSLDTSFGAGGKVVTDFAGGTDQAKSLAIMSDGRIVLAGCAAVSGKTRLAVARYSATGQLDGTFDTDGKLTTLFAAGSCVAQGVVALSNGSVVVAGTATSFITDTSDFVAIRYLADGSLDATFGAGGWAMVDMGGTNDEAHGLVLQSDGKLVLVGNNMDANSGTCDFAMVRLSTNGTLDASFGSAGRVVTDFGGDVDQAMTAAIQADGKIVVAGLATVDWVTSFGLARYNTGGSLDTTFAGGKVMVPFGLASVASGLAIDAAGNVVVTGFTMNDQGAFDIAVARMIGRVNIEPIANAGGPYTVDADGSVQLNGAGSSDPDGNIVSYEWDFNYDGVTFGADATGVAPTFSAAGLAGLVRTVALRVTDNDGATRIVTTTVTVGAAAPPPTGNDIELRADPNTPGMKVLIVHGTSKSDCLRIGSTSDRMVEVTLNGKLLGKFANVCKVQVWGGDGNDFLDAHASRVPVQLFGENGNDLLFGSRFNDILVGGNGNDGLFGWAGNDLIVGGMGRDHLHGRFGNDLLVGCTLSCEGDVAALESVLTRWNSTGATTGNAIAALGTAKMIDDHACDHLFKRWH